MRKSSLYAAPTIKAAYRPPGARGQLASDAYQRREDEHSSGASTPVPTPMFKGGKPSQRYVPGQSVPGAPGAAAPGAGQEDKKKRTRSKKNAANANANGNGNGAAEPEAEAAAAPVEQMSKVDIKDDAPAAGGEDEGNAKRIRNLVKKVSEMAHSPSRTMTSHGVTRLYSRCRLGEELNCMQNLQKELTSCSSRTLRSSRADWQRAKYSKRLS
jgi:hypothetical protein